MIEETLWDKFSASILKDNIAVSVLRHGFQQLAEYFSIVCAQSSIICLHLGMSLKSYLVVATQKHQL